MKCKFKVHDVLIDKKQNNMLWMFLVLHIKYKSELIDIKYGKLYAGCCDGGWGGNEAPSLND